MDARGADRGPAVTELLRAHRFVGKRPLREDMLAGLYPNQRECACGSMADDPIHRDKDANRRDLETSIQAANIRPRDAARVILAAAKGQTSDTWTGDRDVTQEPLLNVDAF